MKKFGTPIGAGPGTENEYVGFDGVGTPLGVTGGGGVAALVFFLAVFFFLAFLPFSTFPEPSDRALPGDWVEVVVVEVVVVFDVDLVELVVGFGFEFVFGLVELEGEVEVEVEVEVVCGWVLVVTVTAGVVAVTGGQDQTTFVIGSVTGSGSDVGGVFAGMFWNVNCWPPATVIVTVHPSADASGMAARPNTTTTHAAVAAALISFRLVNTVAYSSRGAPRTNSSQLRSQIGLRGRYWLLPRFAIRNRQV
jgi:hypothetical protein